MGDIAPVLPQLHGNESAGKQSWLREVAFGTPVARSRRLSAQSTTLIDQIA
jgi:hypothetical protein